MMVGSLAAAGVGAGFPLLAIILGSMTDDFIKGLFLWCSCEQLKIASRAFKHHEFSATLIL